MCPAGSGGAGQRGEGTPPYTPFTDRISQGAAAAHRRANRFPATVVPVNWGTFSKLPRFAAYLVCVVGCDVSIAPHDRRRGYSCYAKATQAGRALRWIESKTMQKHGAFGLKSKPPGRAGGCLWLPIQEEGPRQCRGPSSSQYLFAVKIRRTACAVKARL